MEEELKKKEAKVRAQGEEIRELERQLNSLNRENKRSTQDTSTKDARLNRMAEELESFKLRMREQKEADSSKSEELRQ